MTLTDGQLDTIRQLDENDSPVTLSIAIGELLDEVNDLRPACLKWREIFCGFPHDAQQALRDMRQRLAELTKARDEIAGLARFMWTYNGQVPQAVMNDIERLAGVGTTPTSPRIDDESRCAICQWPLAETAEKGCVRGNCSMRPLPANYYAPERAAREHADMIRGAAVEQRGKEQG